MFMNDCIISFVAVSCIKLLFLPLYKSTDFEVHRNWMAITHEKPVKDWYLEETSQWTLDYPPFFAWFEYFLSTVAKYFDESMLKISNLNYASSQTVFFMRLSVIISDIVYCYGVHRIFQLIKAKKGKDKDPWLSAEVILAMLLLWNPGLLIVDHIHFQYNGFLNGFLFLSIADMLQGKYVRSAFWFSVLLNLKHIYLYLSPAYFIFLLKNYCFKSDKSFDIKTFSMERFLKLASVGITTVLISFGPFIYLGQLGQVLSRLFPVQRGLTHSYWAPNVWALYNFADRILSFIAYRLKIYSPDELQTCSTRGVVKECEYVILPTISSNVTFLFALISLLPMIWLVWKKPGTPRVFINSIVLCSFGTFLFGYHVHEKAILLIILPLTVSAVLYKEEAGIYAFLSILGHFSLFPLLHQEGETLLKIFLLLLHAVYMFSSLSQLHSLKNSIISNAEMLYLGGLVLLQLFYSFGLKMSNLENKLPFLPLMLISTYCALGVVYTWIKYCFMIVPVQSASIFKVKKK